MSSSEPQGGFVEPVKFSDLETMRTGINEAVDVCGRLWLSYLLFAFYLAVSAGAVTHLDLFLERPVRLPLLNIDLPLLAFFCLSPALLLIFHTYLLVHFAILSDKASRFRDMVGAFERAGGVRGDAARRLLSNNIFVQFLAGPPELRSGGLGWTLRMIAWFTLAIAPVLVLLLLQLQFLPYQSATVTWLHRLALIVDLALLWWLWGYVLSSRLESDDPASHGRLGQVYAVAATAVTVVFSCLIAGTQDEPMAGAVGLRGVQQAVFRSDLDNNSRRPVLPFSNRLVLANVNVAELAGAQSAAWAGKTAFVLQARGRNFRGAVFDHAILTRGDFTGAHLEGASFFNSALDNSSFDRAAMRGASFTNSTARGTSFEDAELEGARFDGANLALADFARARLAGAAFDHAGLSGAKFRDADLRGASLVDAAIFAVNFQGAKLASADFAGAAISNCDFLGADLGSARIAGAKTFFANDLDDELQRKVKDDGLAGAELRAKQAELFAGRLCVVGADNAYIMKAETFTRMKGGEAVQMIRRILSPECVTSKTLADEDSIALRSRLAELEKEACGTARGPKCGSEAAVSANAPAAGGAAPAPAAEK